MKFQMEYLNLANKFKFIILFLISLTLVGCSNSSKRIGTNDKTLIVGVDDSFVPMGFQKKSGELTGYDIDLARLVGKKIHRKMEFQTIDWSMKETELRNKTIDLIWNGYTKTPERARQVAFTKSYLHNEQVLVVMKSSGINYYKNLTDKSVGVQTSSTGYSDLTEHPQILKNRIKKKSAIQYNNIEDGMVDLKSGRIQGFLIDRVFAEYYLKHDPNGNELAILKVPFKSENFAVGLRKSDKKDLKKINKALDELAADGTLNRLNHKWFNENIGR